VEIKCILSS